MITRRGAIITGLAAGAGLALGFHFVRRGEPVPEGPPFEPNVWLRIGTDDVVTITVAKAEMGQGVHTSLAMLVAEELEADWSKVRVVQAPVHQERYGFMGTGGSTSVQDSWDTLRKAGATAREMLVAAAAKLWRVDPGECRAESGAIVHAGGRRQRFGDLTTLAATLPVPADVRLKDPSDFKLLGKRIHRIDTPAKVTGQAIFGIDVRVPGMLFASIEQCPTFGGKLARFDDAAARRVPGVRHVEAAVSGVYDVADIQGVVVVADNTWAAFAGRRALEVAWDHGPNAQLSSESIAALYEERGREPGSLVEQAGDVERASRAASKTLDVTYDCPFLAHATMEPQNVTAWVHDGIHELWCPTQWCQWIQRKVAKVCKVPLEQVKINVTWMGGGFGRRSHPDSDMFTAIELSKKLGKPIQIVWTREDDMRHDYYRPRTHHVLRGAVDAQGLPTVWTHRLVAGNTSAQFRPEKTEAEVADRTIVHLYDVEHQRLEYKLAQTPVVIGAWRSVSLSHNVFANESFIDELAALGGRDPVELRLRLLTDKRIDQDDEHYSAPRLRKVLEVAAERAGWGGALPAGRARGVACYAGFGSHIAEVAEVSVENGAIKVHRVVCAVDCGMIVNPDTVEAQVEGGIVFGLSAALYGRITIAGGHVVERSFGDYPLVDMRGAPKVETTIVRSTEHAGGIGETAVPAVAPAVANALFTLTGKRIRRLPLSV